MSFGCFIFKNTITAITTTTNIKTAMMIIILDPPLLPPVVASGKGSPAINALAKFVNPPFSINYTPAPSYPSYYLAS